MKKLLLLLLVFLSSITYAQKFNKVYRASLIVYENETWVTKQNVYPKSIMVITNGSSVKITNEYESSYMTYGVMEKKSYDTYECYSWDAFDKNGKALTMANNMKQALASDFKTAIVDTGNSAEKGLGDAVDHINTQWGPIIAGSDPLAK
jgi:hypothetical protein